jgi:hypothetical protein
VIERWEVLPDPNERFPGRCRVNVVGSEADVRPVLDHFAEKTGKPWAPRTGGFRLSFYFYGATPEDRRALERLLAGEPPDAAAAEEPVRPAPRAAPVSAAEPEVEFMTDDAPAPAAARADTPSSLVQSATDALMDWAGAPSPSPARTSASARPAEPPREPSLPPSEASPLVVSTADIGMPEDELIVNNEPEPKAAAGRMFLRLGYFVPRDSVELAERIQSLVVQTLESRRMPFVFHKAFVFAYRWPDKPLADQVVEACRKHKVDGMVCVGEEKRLELLFEELTENGVKFYFLSRDGAQKKYWRLGLITRMVVGED